jgi:hypothetical protein
MICSSGILSEGGIWRLSSWYRTAWMSGLWSGSPGTTDGLPELPPLRMPARESSSRPPWTFSASAL